MLWTDLNLVPAIYIYIQCSCYEQNKKKKTEIRIAKFVGRPNYSI